MCHDVHLFCFHHYLCLLLYLRKRGFFIETIVKERLKLIKTKAAHFIEQVKVSWLEEGETILVCSRSKLHISMVRWSSGLESATNKKWIGTLVYNGYEDPPSPSLSPSLPPPPSLSPSVNQMAIVARHAIEQEKKLLHELLMPGLQFNINEVSNVMSYS